MKRTRIFTLGILSLVLCLILGACGAAKADMDEWYVADVGNGYFEKVEMEADIALPEKDMPSGMDGGYVSAPIEDSISSDAAQYAEKVIRNVSMYAESRDFDRALEEIRASVAFLGGYEQSVNVTGKSYHSSTQYCRTARMTLRIPAESLDAFLGEVGKLVNVTSETMNSTNVTAEYYDMEARISVLESEKAAYEEMLKKSDDVTYLLKIKDRLYDVIEEIESYKTQLRVYDNKVAYSTVTMTLDEVIEYTPIVTPRDSFGTRIANAFRESWQDFADGCQSLFIGLVYSLPTLLVLGVIGAGIFAVVLVLVKKAKEKATAKHTDA